MGHLKNSFSFVMLKKFFFILSFLKINLYNSYKILYNNIYTQLALWKINYFTGLRLFTLFLEEVTQEEAEWRRELNTVYFTCGCQRPLAALLPKQLSHCLIVMGPSRARCTAPLDIILQFTSITVSPGETGGGRMF